MSSKPRTDDLIPSHAPELHTFLARVEEKDLASGFIGGSSSVGKAPLIVGTRWGAATSSLAEVTLLAITLPAGALSHDGDQAVIKLWGQFQSVAAAGSNGTLRVKFGATYVLNAGPAPQWNVPGPAAANLPFMCEIRLVRTGAATQVSIAAGDAAIVPERAVPGETLSGAIIIGLRGFVSVGTSTLRIDGASLEVLAP